MPHGEIRTIGAWKRGTSGARSSLTARPRLPNPLNRLYRQDRLNLIRRKTMRDARKLVGKALIQSLAPRLALRFIPAVGLVITAMDVFYYMNKDRLDRPQLVMIKRPEGVFLVCGSLGGPLNGTGAFSCGFEHLHHKSHDGHFHYYVADDTYRIASVPENTWTLNSNYWDSRSPQDGVLGVWSTAPGADQPSNMEGISYRYTNPWDDVGPAPAPQPDVRPSEQPLPRDLPPGGAPMPLTPPVRRIGRIDPFFNPQPVPDTETETAPKFDRSPPPANTLPPAAPTVIFEPFKPTKISLRPHRVEPPKKRTVERKVKGLILRGSVLAWALGTITEGLDILYCFYDALPPKYRQSRYANDRALLNNKWTNTTIRKQALKGTKRTKFIKRPPPGETVRRILDYLDTGDFYQDDGDLVDQERYMNRVFACIVENGVQDLVIGLTAGAAARRLGQLFHKISPGDVRARAPLTGLNPSQFLNF